MQCSQGCVLKMFQEGKTKPHELTALVRMDVKGRQRPGPKQESHLEENLAVKKLGRAKPGLLKGQCLIAALAMWFR